MSPNTQFAVSWVDGGKEPTQPPDPRYPDGIDLDISRGVSNSCTVELPCPAPRIGHYLVICKICGLRVSCTTAGRKDDPRSVTIPCRPITHAA